MLITEFDYKYSFRIILIVQFFQTQLEVYLYLNLNDELIKTYDTIKNSPTSRN